MNKTVDGIILEVKDYREYDAILRVLTFEDGMISVVAKGIRKIASKNAAVSQRFMHVRFYLDYKEGQTIHGMRTADKLESFRHIREDLIKQSIASVLCDMLLSFCSDMEKEVYEKLFLTFKRLDQTAKPYAPAAMFLAYILALQGMKPVVERCVHCGSVERICSFSAADGGFVCADCYRQEMRKETREDLKCFRLLVLADDAHYDVMEQYAEWSFHHFDGLFSFFEQYSGIHLKSMRFLRNIETMDFRNS